MIFSCLIAIAWEYALTSSLGKIWRWHVTIVSIGSTRPKNHSENATINLRREPLSILGTPRMAMAALTAVWAPMQRGHHVKTPLLGFPIRYHGSGLRGGGWLSRLCGHERINQYLLAKTMTIALARLINRLAKISNSIQVLCCSKTASTIRSSEPIGC